MGTYKGNKGNLMQHWTLCEALSIANRYHSALNYIDAHAMAPLAKDRTGTDVVFDRVWDRLANGNSTYEKAWCALAPRPADGYPNSARFLVHVWKHKFSLALCDISSDIRNEIDEWLPDVTVLSNCQMALPPYGNWRDLFKGRLPLPEDVGLGNDVLTIVSFDPYVISKSPRYYPSWSPHIYPADLDTIGAALGEFNHGVILQFSTYDNNGPNPQSQVQGVLDMRLSEFGFTCEGKTSPNLKMMSLIYARGVRWADQLGTLGNDFTRWLSRV